MNSPHLRQLAGFLKSHKRIFLIDGLLSLKEGDKALFVRGVGEVTKLEQDLEVVKFCCRGHSFIFPANRFAIKLQEKECLLVEAEFGRLNRWFSIFSPVDKQEVAEKIYRREIE